MPAQNLRITTAVEQDLARWLKKRSKAQGRSVSNVVRDILRAFYEEHEERFWAKEGEERLQTFRESESISHEDAWS